MSVFDLLTHTKDHIKACVLTLDIISHSWTQLSHAYPDMVAPLATASGLANMYGKIPYKSPAAACMPSLGPLNDALICGRRFDDPEVADDFGALIDAIRKDKGKDFIAARRKQAVANYKERLETVKRLEAKYYGYMSISKAIVDGYTS